MRVEDSHAQTLACGRHHVEGRGKKEGHDEVKDRRDHCHDHGEGRALGRHRRADAVAISDEARARFESMKKRFSGAGERAFSIPGGLDPKGLLNRLVTGAFGGKEISVTGVLGQDGATGATGAAYVPVAAAAVGASGFSAEVEQLNFSASGTIKTADGEEVGFTLELNVTRASLSGYSAGAAAGQDGLSVSFGGSSTELFSMSFEFSVNSGEQGAGEGIGRLFVDKPGKDHAGVAEDDHHHGEDRGADALAKGVHDFLKLLKKAEFTSTYASFSRTTVQASGASFALDQAGAPALPANEGAQPIDLVA